MQIQIFTIPVLEGQEEVEKMNKFLRGKKVLQVEQEFYSTTGGAFWCYSVKYLDSVVSTTTYSKGKKERIICAASFPERVLHHALMNICHPVFENYQIYDSYATRKGKGTYAALERAKSYHARNFWFLKMDVRKYFDSIDQSVLLQLLERRFKDKRLLDIFKQIVDSYATEAGKGIPIGNLTSQYFANFYLAYADRFIKHDLKIKCYVRYMDDMVLWSNDKAELLSARKAVTNYLSDKLQLDLKVAFLNRSSQGLSFIGYRLYPDFIKLNQRSKRRFVTKMKRYHYNLTNDIWSQADYQRHTLPLLAFTQHAKTHQLRQKVLA